MPTIVKSGKTIELTDAEHDQIMKCPNYIYKTNSGHLVRGLESNVITDTKVCKASDPALKLAFSPASNIYYAADDKSLQQLCTCTTIDYAYIGKPYVQAPPKPGGGTPAPVSTGCMDCKQETLDACQLKSISGRDPYFGKSLAIHGPAPLITSLRGLAGLNGSLPGGMIVSNMDELTTLEGLGNITRIGQDSTGASIWLDSNPKLASAMALSTAGNFTSTALYISNNKQLACVPKQWPAIDLNGNTIRNGKALYDPCLYQCDSTTKTCSQTAIGNQILSECTLNC